VNAAGNLTARGADSFAYDHANRLTGATVAGTTTTYAYDGDGIRVARTQGSTTGYVYDRASSLPTVIDDGTRRYVLGPSGLAYSLVGSTPSVHHADALGSVRALTDSAAALTQRYGRDAWGTSTATQGSSTQPFGFTGELNDAASGLLHLRARDYDPATGRFMQRDTFAGRLGNPLSLHRYGYAFNNPVSLRDPSGRDPLIDGGTGTGCLSCDVMADAAAVVDATSTSAAAAPVLDSGMRSSSLSTSAATPSPIEPAACTNLLCGTVQNVLFGAGSSVGTSGGVLVVQNASAGSAYGAIAEVLGGSSNTVVLRSDLIVSRTSFLSGGQLHRHEFGHIEQARLLGVGYLPEYVIEFLRLRTALGTDDRALIRRNHWMEINANIRAGLQPFAQ